MEIKTKHILRGASAACTITLLGHLYWGMLIAPELTESGLFFLICMFWTCAAFVSGGASFD